MSSLGFKLSRMISDVLRSTASDTTAQFKSWIWKWFTNVACPVPFFRVSGNDIKVLHSPEEFYAELVKQSSLARRRITLASLYLGYGELERNLVNAIYENLKHKSDDLKLNVLLEYTRGSRGAVNSRTLLLPLLRDFPARTSVNLFHTPNLRGFLRAVVPERFNETINVTHIKVYLFDDTLILSGANLSKDYFTNRQDRYYKIERCKDLCDYFDDLVASVGRFSFSLRSDDSCVIKENFGIHPYRNSKKSFNLAANAILKSFVDRHAYRGLTDDHLGLLDFNFDGTEACQTSKGPFGSEDTLIFPLLQMQPLGIVQDEVVTNNIISSAPSNSKLLMATAYFNLTKEYWRSIMMGHSEFDIVMAHPKAMGFYNAPGMAGGIPLGYNLIAKRCYRDMVSKKQLGRVSFFEYFKPDWTFHGKGLWAHLVHETHLNDSVSSASKLRDCPMMTLIGSPNFGKRSVYRDLEAQVGIITSNPTLRMAMAEERDLMKSQSALVTEETYAEKDRRTLWWVYLIATFMNDQF